MLTKSTHLVPTSAQVPQKILFLFLLKYLSTQNTQKLMLFQRYSFPHQGILNLFPTAQAVLQTIISN